MSHATTHPRYLPPALLLDVVVVLLVDVLPHDEEDGGADEAVLDGAGEQEGARRRQQPRHDVVRVVLALAQAELFGEKFDLLNFILIIQNAEDRRTVQIQ